VTTEAEFVRVLPSGNEAWQRGSILFVVPAIPDNASPDLKNALDRRRRATLNGRCDCGARVVVSSSGLIAEHESSCPATDEAIERLQNVCACGHEREVHAETRDGNRGFCVKCICLHWRRPKGES
jgi:hypothetical protein